MRSANPLVAAIEAIADAAPAAPRGDDAFGPIRVAAVRWLLSGVAPSDLAPLPALDGLRAAGPDAWCTAYEALTGHIPVVDDGRVRLEPDRQARKRRGSWYTPSAVVDAVLDHALDPILTRETDPARVATLRIVDPAAGAGRFLLGAARRVSQRLIALGLTPPAARRTALGCVHGADLDPGALALARGILEDFAGPDPTLASRLMCGDALACSPDLTTPAVLPGTVPWAYIERFDVVVGNPPFRAGRLAGLDRADVQRLFPTAEYQVDPYVLFLEQAARLARDRMALLVPTTWMSNHRGRKLRRYLLGEHRLRAVVEVPIETFDAAVETAVPIFEVGQGPTAHPVPLLDLAGEPIGSLHPDPERLDAPLPLTRSPRAAALLAASRRWTTTLGDVSEINRGINPYHHTTHTRAQIKARVHHADHQVAADWSPELRGRDLPGPYRLDWKGTHWIHYGPWLKEPRAPRFFEGPRLLVRKILGETLHGVYVEHAAYCDQSVYIARVAPDCPYPAHALLACVNSRLIAALIRTRHQTHQAHFPQLKVGELRGLPLPPAPPEDPRWAALAEQAAKMQADPDDALREAIEATVADLYGFAAP